MIMSILGFAGDVIKTVSNGWLEEKKTTKLVRLQQIKDTSNWEALQSKASITSWKDEYWTIVLSIPVILAFFPGMAEYIAAGFEVISQMPAWYRYCVVMAIGAAFGVKLTKGFIGKVK
ncbi:hypothetical protein LCGC14_0452050 [marine sediment metagenome]|uniref:Uncharacterized protein n=1 Tax=marine sediment metagenome TaxID=412755 RepID=A0A0F9SMU2_9ZZZZ